MNKKSIAVCILSKTGGMSASRVIDSIKSYNIPIYLGVTQRCDSSRSRHNPHYINWENDFSKARNTLLSKVKEEFVLWLDDDDELISFENITDTISDEMVLFNVKIQHRAEDTNCDMLRLHRNHCGVFWRGAVHERLVMSFPSEANYGYVNEITIKHHGYEEVEVLKYKHNRNNLIATEAIKTGDFFPGHILAQARYKAFNKLPSFKSWMTLYQIANAYQNEHDARLYLIESVMMMSCMGFSKPAVNLLKKEPGIVPLHISIIISRLLSADKIEKSDLNNLYTLLKTRKYDTSFPFPSKLLNLNRNSLIDWITEMTSSFATDANMKDFNEVGYYYQTPGVQVQEFGEDNVLIHPTEKSVSTLNETATAIWSILQTPHNIQSIKELIEEAQESKITDQQLASVIKLFRELLSSNLITEKHD